jgi:hypothetical protein
MNISELVNQNEGPTEGILDKIDPVAHQSFNPEQLPAIGQVIQQDSHETAFEYESKTSLRDVVISSLVLLSFAALLIFVYLVLPS